jgi:hypothetical protein
MKKKVNIYNFIYVFNFIEFQMLFFSCILKAKHDPPPKKNYLCIFVTYFMYSVDRIKLIWVLK